MAKRDKDSDSDSGSSSSGDEWGKKAKKKGKRVKSVKEEEEREEGEVDDDEDDDLDDDDDDDIDEFNDGFDENLMGDEEDQKRLAEMTEKEREQELFNRSEKREVLRTRFEIERKLRLQKRKENQKASKNPDFTEASLRSDERRRNIEAKKKQNSALQGLKEQREKKKAKAQILRAADVYSSSSSSDDDDDDGGRKGSSSSSSSSTDDSDDEGGRGRKHRSRRSDDETADDYDFNLVDLNRIRVTRRQLELWVHSPFFQSTVKDSFVKMGIGCRDGRQIYRVCQVVDVVDGPRVYDLERTKTNKLLKCRHSKDDRNFRLEYVSNGDFVDSEFDEWKQRCLRDGLTFPTRGQVESKRRDIENAMNYRYNDSDIAFMLKEKEKFNKTPKNYAMKKTELMKKKEEAEQNNNHELVHQLQGELDQLEERAKELDKARTHSIAAISYINERNRLKNIAEAEKAILEAQEENKGAEADDPFRRRKCAPQLVHKVAKTKIPDGDKNPDGTPVRVEGKESNGSGVDGVSRVAGGSSVVDGPSRVAGDSFLAKLEVKQERKQSLSPPPDDLFNAHDFDIQIDFDPVGTSMLPTGATVSGNNSFSSIGGHGPTDIKPPSNRRSLNLEEYKRKKGLI